MDDKFSYRSLSEHWLGKSIVDRDGAGVADNLAIDSTASFDRLRRVFLAILRKASDAGHARVYFVLGDTQIEALYCRFGLRPLPLPSLGVFDLAANRERIAALSFADAA